jgi:two-component sensor histidine kinase
MALFTKSRIKLAFGMIAFIFISIILVYSHIIVRDLRHDSQKTLSFYAMLFARMAEDDRFDDFSFMLDEMIGKLSFPIIITAQKQAEVTAWKNIPDVSDHARLDDSLAQILTAHVRDMDRYADPVPLEYQGMTLGYIHYGDSISITRLKWMPYYEIAGAALLIIFGFFAFDYVRSSEKKFIWVGMAKETAHQLGTPISSLMGWLELAKGQFGSEQEAFKEMSEDVSRLERVSNRFSQIGSKVKRSPLNLAEVMENVENYMKRRIPQKNSSVELVFLMDPEQCFPVKGNSDLLEWALENLIKNGVDALEGEGGTITVKCVAASKKQLVIDISDTGRGIPEKQWESIFQPGFSSKKRGWGLGLSLTRRIIEEYHHGRVFVLNSELGQGTTFRILLS